MSIIAIDRSDWHDLLRTSDKINRVLWQEYGERWRYMVGARGEPAGRAGQAGACDSARGAMAGDQGGETGMAEGATGRAREARADAIQGDGAHQ